MAQLVASIVIGCIFKSSRKSFGLVKYVQACFLILYYLFCCKWRNGVEFLFQYR